MSERKPLFQPGDVVQHRASKHRAVILGPAPPCGPFKGKYLASCGFSHNEVITIAELVIEPATEPAP
jgi:hypothetical protein